ncbi:SbcC/MukB-like Walker B domain-containing protein, partial [Planobispora siamensis]
APGATGPAGAGALGLNGIAGADALGPNGPDEVGGPGVIGSGEAGGLGLAGSGEIDDCGLAGSGEADDRGMAAFGLGPGQGLTPQTPGLRELLRAWERDRRDALAGLEGLRADEARLAELEAEISGLDDALRELADREAELAGARSELPAVLAEASARLAAARTEAAGIPQARAAADAAAATLEAARRRDALRTALETAKVSRAEAVDHAQELRDRLQELRQARIDGMAAELAAKLVPGEPCTVCGSPDHPAPAAPAAQAPTADDEGAAQLAYDAALERRQAAENEVATLTSQLGDALGVAGELTVAEAGEVVADAGRELDALLATAEAEPGLAGEVERLTSELEAVTARAGEIARDLAEGHARRNGAHAEQARLTARLDAARGGDATVQARRDRLTAEAAALATALAAALRTEEIAARHQEAATRHGIDRDTFGTRQDGPADGHAASDGVKASDGAEGRAGGHLAADDAKAPGDARDRIGDHFVAGGTRALDGAEGRAGGHGAMAAVAPSGEVGGTGHTEPGPLTFGHAVQDLREAERLVEALRESAGAVAALMAEAESVTAELRREQERSRALAVESSARRANLDALTADADRLSARLDEARGEDPTLAARLERLTDEAELLREALEATREERSTAAELETARARAVAAVTEAGFRGLDDARAAVRPAAEQEDKARQLRDLDRERAAVDAQLADPELISAAAESEPDLETLKRARDAADAAHAGVISARDRAEARRARLVTLRAELADCLDRWRPAAERHRLADRLAALTSGNSTDNRWNMRLSSYVLGERLRQVVASANERLDHMSGGRYLLDHDLRRSAGDRSRSGGGLGLRILDGWTGVDRDPATLSGGESFITSLALALGLADVVTAEAGGAELGTLFVDEGFGTLDEDTLDGVLDILDGLRDGGRAVGIVSHVGELRTRVPAQLRIRKDRHGSTIHQ